LQLIKTYVEYTLWVRAVLLYTTGIYARTTRHVM